MLSCPCSLLVCVCDLHAPISYRQNIYLRTLGSVKHHQCWRK